MELSPVILFTYNRAGYTRSVLDALAKNYLASQTAVYAFATDSSDAESIQAEAEVAAVLSDFKDKFGKFQVIRRPRNMSVADQMHTAIEMVLQWHSKVICLEDDLVVTPNFLNYMNSALEFYKDNAEVFSICGYSGIKMKEAVPCDAFVHNGFRSFSYALWSHKYKQFEYYNNRYELLDFDWNEVLNTIPQYFNMNLWILDLPLFSRQIQLDAIFTIYCYKNHLYQAFPAESYCECIDTDNLGLSHVTWAPDYSILSAGKQTDFEFSNEHLKDIASDDAYYDFIVNAYLWDKSFEYRSNSCRALQLAYTMMCASGLSFDGWFAEHGLNKIAIYAMGRMGRTFYSMVKRSPVINVAYAIDRDPGVAVPGLAVCQTQQEEPEVDAVIITNIPEYFPIKRALTPDVPVYDVLSIAIEILIKAGVIQKLDAQMSALLEP